MSGKGYGQLLCILIESGHWPIVVKKYKEWKYWHCEEGQCRNFLFHKMSNWVLLRMQISCNLSGFCSLDIQQRMDFCWEQFAGIFLYHCWESYYSFQMLRLIHGWAMHKEEIGNKICLIWLFSAISKINISNRNDIWQIRKCLLGIRGAKLDIFIKITNILALWDDRWRQGCWDFRSFIPTQRRMQDELCEIRNWGKGMNLIISKYCFHLIWHKRRLNLDMGHLSKNVLYHMCVCQPNALCYWPTLTLLNPMRCNMRGNRLKLGRLIHTCKYISIHIYNHVLQSIS